MKITNNLKAAVFVAALSIPAFSRAGDITKCDEIAERVRQAVEKEPNKVLVIVEDFMVSNESCACEIVKTAIRASKAKADMVKQIVLTATNVAPKYAGLIAECAGAIAPEAGVASVGGKNALGVQPETIQPVAPVGEVGSETDYRMTPYDVRGVYLIQPSSAGVVTTTETTGTTVRIVKRTPSRHSLPQSPSVAQGP